MRIPHPLEKSIAAAMPCPHNPPRLRDSPSNSSDKLKARLRASLSARFGLLDEKYTIAGRDFAFTRVADPERVLDDVIAAEAKGAVGRMPYWAELWESALGCGEWMFKNRECVADHRVLDLGCGMGFAGMVAASLGGRVLFADIEPQSLEFAELNSADWHASTRSKVLDWTTDRLNETFDLIVGADVLYERAQWDHLEPFWQTHLAAKGKVLLGEPSRPTGESFAEWVRACGWKVSIQQIRLEDRNKTIRLFELSR